MRCFLLCFFSVLGLTLQAQTIAAPLPKPTESDFVLQLTNPICEGDGELTVSCKKDLSGWPNIIYELHFPTGHILSQSSPLFRTLSGHENDYVLTISGANNEVDPVTGTASQTFEVEKRFKLPKGYRLPHRPTWVSTNVQYDGSRPSFIDNLQTPAVDLRLGTLVFNVETNVPPERIKFRLEKAPTPDLVGLEPTYKRSGTRYTLDGTYPAGDYQVYVHDGCSEVPVDFTLDALQYPISAATFGLQYDAPQNAAEAAAKNSDCSTFWLNTDFTGDINLRLKLYRYRYDGLLEYGFSPTGTAPTSYHPLLRESSVWWYDRDRRMLVHTKETTKDLYGKTLYDAHIRVKGSATDSRTTQPLKMHPIPYLNDLAWRNKEWECSTFKTRPLYFTYGDPCYPLHYTVTEKETNTKVYENKSYYPENQKNDWVSGLKPNHTYIFKIVSADGISVEQPLREDLYFREDKVYRAHYMDGLYPKFQTNVFCGMTLRLKDKATGDVLHEQLMKGQTEVLNYKIAYDKDYIVEQVTERGDVINSLPVRRSLILPKEFPHVAQFPDLCTGDPLQPHVLRQFFLYLVNLQIYQNPDYAFPVGTIIDITADIPGFVPRSLTVEDVGPEKDYLQQQFEGTLSWPPGDYTATCNLGGTGQMKVYHFKFRGASSLERPLSVDIQRECGGWNITADWHFKTQGHYGEGSGSCALVREANNSLGWEQVATLSNGNTIKVDRPGRYQVRLMGHGDARYWNMCVWDKKEFELKENRPKLVPNKTLAFMCNENHPEAAVMISVNGGSPPYTYELFKSENKVPQGAALFTTNNIEALNQVIWDAPFNPEYQVRVTDGCGERATFEFYPKPVEKIQFAQVSAQYSCEGEPLQVFTYDIPNSTFEWTHPDGTKSFGPVIDIEESDAARHSGTYYLKQQLNKCGKTITSSIEVKITPRLKNVELPDVVACAGVPATFAVTHQDGRAPYTYRWEEFLPDEGKWVPIAYQNGPTYQTRALIDKPVGATYVVRAIVTDACGRQVQSRESTATVRSCYVPINPHLMHRVK